MALFPVPESLASAVRVTDGVPSDMAGAAEPSTKRLLTPGAWVSPPPPPPYHDGVGTLEWQSMFEQVFAALSYAPSASATPPRVLKSVGVAPDRPSL